MWIVFYSTRLKCASTELYFNSVIPWHRAIVLAQLLIYSHDSMGQNQSPHVCILRFIHIVCFRCYFTSGGEYVFQIFIDHESHFLHIARLCKHLSRNISFLLLADIYKLMSLRRSLIHSLWKFHSIKLSFVYPFNSKFFYKWTILGWKWCPQYFF